MKRLKIFILGAGFSQPAGLPLGEELWSEVLKRARSHDAGKEFFRDLDAYIKYMDECEGIELQPEKVDFEEFMGFLDIEHYLHLRGGRYWSRDGYPGQRVVKKLLGQILSARMPAEIPDLYIKFAQKLQSKDLIITFNYDVLLEQALHAIGKDYRLFAFPFSELDDFGGIIDQDREEVVILKMHGSIDWFDKTNYLALIELNKDEGITRLPNSYVFNNRSEDWGIESVLNGLRHEDDPLINLHRIKRVRDLYRMNRSIHETPWLIPPSTHKIVYADALSGNWSGLGITGETTFSMAIIGYSLPEHDLYARQAIYSLVKNYQEVYWGEEGEEIWGIKKFPLLLVDKQEEATVAQYKSTYRFVDYDKTELHLDGFNSEALDKIFRS